MPVSIALTEDRFAAIISLIPPAEKGQKITAEQVVKELEELQFPHYLSDRLIEKAVHLFNTTRKVRSKFRIYRDDFLDLEQYFTVTISADEMAARLTVRILPELVEQVSFGFLKRLLMKHGIAAGVLGPELNDLVKMLAESPHVEKHPVAAGEPEVFAVDGEFKLHQLFSRIEKIERMVKRGNQRRKVVSKARITDAVIDPGTVLLIKYLPVDGKEGLTVTNKHLWSETNKKRVQDLVVVVSKNVTARKFSDRVEYLSTVKGLGYFIDNRIIEVVEVLDGEFRLSPSDDKMELFLSLKASRGGKDLDLQEIKTAIEKLKIKVPVDYPRVVRELARVNNGEVEMVNRTVIARGQPPEHGLNGELKWYTNLEQFYKPNILEDGRVDYRGGQCYPYAREGVPVGVWHLATGGIKSGQDIFGTELTPDDGIEIGKKLQGFFDFEEAAEEQRKARLLIPKISGLLKIKREEVVIDPVFEVDKVDYATGNIDFEGTLVIKETIAEGFKVRCTKDIHIKGNVGACTIESEGDVIIQGGINGRGKGLISAGKKVHLKFAENCTIQAGEGIFISSHVVLAKLVSRQSILVGLNRTRGKVIGSSLFAWQGIETGNVGTKSSTADSYLHIGIDKLLYDRVEARKKEIEELKLEITKLQQKKSQADPRDLAQVQMIEQELAAKVEFLNEELAACREWEENVYNPEAGSILIKDEIQAHTRLMFGQVDFELVVSKSKISFYLDNNKVAQEPIQRRR